MEQRLQNSSLAAVAPCSPTDIIDFSSPHQQVFIQRLKNRQQEQTQTPKSFSCRIGQFFYSFILVDEHSELVEKVALQRKIVYTVLILFSLSYLSYSFLASFQYNAATQKNNDPVIRLVCTKCGKVEDFEGADISEASCSKCGAPLAYALKCKECGKVIPWNRPIVSENISSRMRRKLLLESTRCTSCKSYETTSSWDNAEKSTIIVSSK